MSSGIKVFAPASVGNAAVGFDCLGFALEKPGDEIIARFSDKKGLRLTKITGKRGKKIPTEITKNTAAYAAYKLLDFLGETSRGIDIELHKKMPLGSGLGSSAASAVAGAMAINELLKRPLEKKELLRFALDGEELASGGRHCDNIAPSLLGGMILIRDNETLDFHRLPLIRGLHATVIYPKVEILTKDARNILSETVTLKQMVQQSANLASVVIGMYSGDLDLIGRALEDVIIEPQRSTLIPNFYNIKNAALEAGALGCSISGAGPSIFALSANNLIAENIGETMKRIYTEAKIDFELYCSPINHQGAIKL